MKKKIQVKILNKKFAKDIFLPTYATVGSAAMAPTSDRQTSWMCDDLKQDV